MIEQKLLTLGYQLPPPADPSFNYIPVTCHNKIAYVSGQLPKVDGVVGIIGKVDHQVSIEQAQQAARICILQGLACLKQALGSLDNIERILKINGYIASSPGFNQQAKVLDAASELLVQLFGEAGRHARAAVGVAELPRNTAIEIEMTVAIK